MSGYFDGRNGRLSKTWRFGRSGKSVKLWEIREIWEIFSFRRSVGTELLPFYLASFKESPESYLVPSRGAVWGTRRSARYTEPLRFL